ncbi:MAG: hypothetical protein GY708_08280, partial [Actinomycetia bacterium]|nr:hypothetical protein [Actinomycetes bacterium]
AAYDYATENPGAACGTATSYLAQNEPTALLVGCDGVPDPISGRVAVTATVNADTFLASILGIDDIDVTTSSVAAWGPPAAVGRFRPLALCIDAPDLNDLLEHHEDDPQPLRIDWLKDDPDDCGDDTELRNWGEIHLDDEYHHSNFHMEKWLEDGYDELIRLGDQDTSTCPEPTGCFRGSFYPRRFEEMESQLDTLIASGEYVLLPVYNFAIRDSASSYRADFHIVGVIRARVDDYDVTSDAEARFFQLTVEPGLISGACCGDSEMSGGSRVLALCGLDPEETEACP